MKQLIAGVVIILVVGIGAFFYRTIVEKPAAVTGETACTAEAMICPDGSSVGRTGPDCSFAACPSSGIAKTALSDFSFVLPVGYEKGVQEPGADGKADGMLDFYQKPAAGGVPHYISVYQYPIPAGKTGDEVILENVRYQPSDMQAADFSRFKTSVIGGRTFRSTVIERFEGQVVSSYFLVRDRDVLRFEVLERDVSGWSDANLVVDELPQHQALVQMLGTLAF